jgi:hypothetical protein
MEYNNNSEYQQNDNSNRSKNSPVGLKVLCILTFIGSGFSLLAYLMFFFMYDALPNMMLTMGDTMGGSFAEYYKETAEIFLRTPAYFFLLMAISYLLSIIGSGCMITMRKVGFHLYVIGQIISLGLPMAMLKSGFNLFGILLSITFIALYGSYLKKMR